MWYLIRRTLRAHTGGLVAPFVALLGACALITAFGIVLGSGLAAGVAPQRYAGTSAVVGAKTDIDIRDIPGGGKTRTKPTTEEAGVPAALVDRIGSVPGVRAVVADRAFATTVVGPDGVLASDRDGRPAFGHGWSSAALTPFTIGVGRAPTGADEVAVDAEFARRARLQPGDTIRVATSVSDAPYRLVGIVHPAATAELPREAALFFTDAQAERLSPTPGRVKAIGVVADGGKAASGLDTRLRRALAGTGAVVYTGDDRGRVEFPDVRRARGDLQELAGALGAAAVLVAILVVASTLAASLHARRREFALLRAVAATPRQIARIVAGETLVVSALAGALGAPLGIPLAFALKAVLGWVGVIPQDYAFTVGPLPPLVAFAGCLLLAQIAAWFGRRETNRVRPVAALTAAADGEARLGYGRAVLGGALLVIGAAGAALPLFLDGILPVAIAGTGGLLMVVAAVVLSPSIVRVAARLLAIPLRRFLGAEGYLAAANALAGSRRLATAIGPLFLAVGFSCVQMFIPATMAAGGGRDVEAGIRADYAITAGATGVPATAIDQVGKVPGVRTVTRLTTTRVYASVKLLGDPQVFDYPALGLDPARLTDTIDLGTRSGDLDQLTQDTVALGRTAAGTLRVGVGDRVPIRLGDGTAIRPRVVAVYDRGLGFGDVVLPHDVVTAHTTAGSTERVLVRTAPGANAKTVRKALDRIAAAHVDVRVTSGDRYGAASRAHFTLALFTGALPLVLVFGYLAIAVTNTLVDTINGRVREFALLRLVGATRRQVLRMVAVETGVVVGTAIAIGTLVPLLPLTTIAYGLTGSAIPAAPPLLYLTIIGTAATIGVAALVIPARITLRHRPIDAIKARS
ncbi:ABC transporter permease [Embleya sp. AB8]|uniref:ABC transporter permease n=1 Tax=Embleya sp. AB8 TaxID=3156304 RepID=UPI003C786065